MACLEGIGSRLEPRVTRPDRADLKGGAPFVLQDVETDTADAVDVWVENFGPEEHLRRSHGVISRKEELSVEHSTLDSFRAYLQRESRLALQS